MLTTFRWEWWGMYSIGILDGLCLISQLRPKFACNFMFQRYGMYMPLAVTIQLSGGNSSLGSSFIIHLSFEVLSIVCRFSTIGLKYQWSKTWLRRRDWAKPCDMHTKLPHFEALRKKTHKILYVLEEKKCISLCIWAFVLKECATIEEYGSTLKENFKC